MVEIVKSGVKNREIVMSAMMVDDGGKKVMVDDGGKKVMVGDGGKR